MPQSDYSDTYPDDVSRFLHRLYAPGNRRWACRAQTPEEVRAWQAEARPALCALLRLDLIEAASDGHTPAVEQGEVKDCGDYTRRACTIETEPDVHVPFWLLKPRAGARVAARPASRGTGPHPLAVTPHGHDPNGSDTSAGVAHNEEHAGRIRAENRDVAVQAARRGFIAIAPATRGLARGFITDAFERFGGAHCTSHFMHGLLAGRTSIGERVWDMQRLIDWACGQEDVDGRDILMMGNSGGGVVTTFAAACDVRIGIAVASCSYSSFVGRNGKIQHHLCNAVPGIMGFGEFWDVAGLIAPRAFLAVHGSEDSLKPTDEVDRAVQALRPVYAAAGVPDAFEQRYGEGGHRFYSDLMWPFIEDAMARRAQGRD